MSQSSPPSPPDSQQLFGEVKTLIQSARQRAAVAVNAELTLLYWQVGQRIHSEVLNGERAEYGKQVIANLARDLTEAFGKGWSQRQLQHCLRFVEVFPDEQIVSALRRELSWTHFKALIYLPDSLKREFYLTIRNSHAPRGNAVVREMDQYALPRRPRNEIDNQLTSGAKRRNGIY